MKKIFSIILIGVVISANAQTTIKSKKGFNILPEANDWALGLNANPFLSYAGNFFNGSFGNPSPFVGFSTFSQTLYGKYFKRADFAYRGHLRLSMSSNKQSSFVSDRTPGAAANSVVENTLSEQNSVFTIGGGVEKRKGSTRLQGFYGGELILGYSGGFKGEYTYGFSVQYAVNPNDSRQTINRGGSSIFVQARAFIGVEYFFAPKMSIGGEFGWGPSFNKVNEAYKEFEFFNNSTSEVETYKNITSKGNSFFNLDNDNANGAIKLMIHF